MLIKESFKNLTSVPAMKQILTCSMRTNGRLVEEMQIRNERNEKTEKFRSYEDIPGPKPLPLIGNNFRFLPYIGQFASVPMFMQLQNFRDTYGDIVKLEGILNKRTSIFLFSPELCEEMYRMEGPWPQRVSLEWLHEYRISRDWIYKGQYGLTTSQGKEWQDFRSKVNQHLMAPRAIKPHIVQIDAIATEFVHKIKNVLRNPKTLEVSSNFNNEMSKWALESTCAVALNYRLGCLATDLSEDSEPQQMINSVHLIFELMYRIENLPAFWKIIKTPDLKKIYHIFDKINTMALKYINQAKEKLNESDASDTHDRSILEKLLRIDEQTALVMALEMLLAGVDTTGNACGSLLYHIANNPRVQNKLHEEVRSALPDKSLPITSDTLNKIPYLKACLKESLRLLPITLGTLRTMQTDVIIGGYKIPEGVNVIPVHGLIAKDSKLFPNPNEFIPERWIRGTTEYQIAKDAHPFSYLPFGFGARSCIGRRFAELEIECLSFKILQNFRIEWHYPPLVIESRIINTIASPLQFKFIDL